MKLRLSILPIAAFLALPLLAGCDNASGSSTGSGATAAAAAGPAGTRFDGRYVGQATLTSSGRAACGAPVQARSMVVQNGVARMVVGISSQTVTGPVGADGSVAIAGETVIRGRIENGVFTGTQQSQSCGRSLNLTRQAARS